MSGSASVTQTTTQVKSMADISSVPEEIADPTRGNSNVQNVNMNEPQSDSILTQGEHTIFIIENITEFSLISCFLCNSRRSKRTPNEVY